MPPTNVAENRSLVLLDFLLLSTHWLVRLGQVVAELLVGRLDENGLLPQVGSQIGIGLSDSSISGFSCNKNEN